jgi:hypothetical protein
MLIISFFLYQFSYRGTETATFNYAYYNEKILGNKSIIISPQKIRQDRFNKDVLDKFVKQFGDIRFISSSQDIDPVMEKEKSTVFFVLKSGEDDGVYSKKFHNIIQCTFDMENKPKNIKCEYVGVSKSVSRGKVLPHIIDLPYLKPESNYRSFLKIPESAIVVGRHGGSDSFNLQFVERAISRVNDIYFLFAGEKPKIFIREQKNVIFIKPFVDDYIKVKFIQTCDYMIHAFNIGESFGISVLEFNLLGKKVITYGNRQVRYTNHLDELDDKILYNNEDDLIKIFSSLKRYKSIRNDKDNKFSPQKVMDIFKGMLSSCAQRM